MEVDVGVTYCATVDLLQFECLWREKHCGFQCLDFIKRFVIPTVTAIPCTYHVVLTKES